MIADAVVGGTPSAGAGIDVAVGRGCAEIDGVGVDGAGVAVESTVGGTGLVVETAVGGTAVAVEKIGALGPGVEKPKSATDPDVGIEGAGA